MFIPPNWLPLIALFVVNQIAMSRVIVRSKRESPNEAQAHREEILEAISELTGWAP